MKITNHIYQLSGVQNSTNSNSYIVVGEHTSVLLDLGYETKQWETMKAMMKFWQLDESKISHAFLTHGHYDHAGNTFRANEKGIQVHCADPDAFKIENGYPEMEKLFGRKWVCGIVNERVHDGDEFDFGDFKIIAYEAKGHSQGSFAYVIEADGHKALLTGDMFFIGPKPPEDDIEIELAYMGGEDFDLNAYIHTLERMSTLHCDILLPGHYYNYYGDVDALFEKAIVEAKKVLEDK